MSDTDPAYIGIEKCGCVTMAQVDRGDHQKDVARFVSDAVKAGCTVERTTVGEAKARENFLPVECPHDPKGWEPYVAPKPKPRTKINRGRDLRIVYLQHRRLGEVRKRDGAWEATRGWFNYREAGADDGGRDRAPVEVLRPFPTLRAAIDALVPSEAA